jgi:hypothetical protein
MMKGRATCGAARHPLEPVMQPYTPELEQTMRQFYASLSEKDRRHYAGVEALKLGQGGRNYLARILGCSRRTVTKGTQEVSGLSGREVEQRIRQPGGGRKPYPVTWAEIDAKFLVVLHDHTAGDPMNAQIRWTNLTVGEIVQALRKDHAITVSGHVVRQLLHKHYYRRRKAQKKLTMREVPLRNAQFEKIRRLRAEYEAAGDPILSMDSKKKEHLGNFYRAGHLYTLEELCTYDHDFTSFDDGVIIPHSLYDVRLNVGYIQLGTSHDTSEFAIESLRRWWLTHGRQLYPKQRRLLLLCDGGGSNDARHYLFKHDLQLLADELGLEIRIAHYPPYTSKYNPIEHRLFPHVTRACQGVIFTSVALVKKLMEKTHTQTGLQVFVQILDQVYETGRKVTATFKETMRIVFDPDLSQWNYRAIPQIANAQVI